MGKDKRLVINMVAQLVSFAVNIGINFWLTPFITKNVGKEVYGFVSLAFQFTSYITIFTIALNAMLGRYVTIKLSQKEYKTARVYFTSVTFANLCISLILVIPSVFLIICLQHIIQIPSAHVTDVKILWAFILGSFLLSLIFEAFGVSYYASNRMDAGARRSIESNLLKAGILFAAYVFFRPSLWYIGMANLINGLFVIITNMISVKKLTPELYLERKSINFPAVRELVRNGVWNSVNMVSQNLIYGLDMIITNLFIGAAQMTLMGFAKTMPVYILQLVYLVSNTFSPQLTRVYAENNQEKFIKEVKSSMMLCGFLCSVPVIGYVVFCGDFFRLWLPVLTSAEIRELQILTILIIAQTMFDVYIFPLYNVDTITCQLKLPVLVNIGVGMGNVIGTLLLLKFTNLGIYSVQLASSVLLTLRVFFFAPLFSAHILKEKWYTFYIPLIRGLMSTVVMVVLFSLVNHSIRVNSWLVFILVACFCGCLGYIVNFWIVFNAEERSRLLQAVRNRLSKNRRQTGN